MSVLVLKKKILITLIKRGDKKTNFAGCRCITVRSLVWIVSIREEEELLVSEML